MEDDVELACRGFKGAVKRYWDKYEKRLPEGSQKKKDVQRQIQQCVKHACYIVRQLSFKKRSLENGVEALEDCWKQTCNRLARQNKEEEEEEETTRETLWRLLLSHVLHQFLRLRDGLILMTSGECRHPGDTTSTSTTTSGSSGGARFPSRLKSLSYCGDGYTRLYSSQNGYTGYGWDEFYNPRVGVQTRLCQCLQTLASFSSSRKKKKKQNTNTNEVWERLLDQGAQALESTMDQHDSAVRQLRQRLDAFRNGLERDLRRLSQSTDVVLVTQDKLERLEVTIPSTVSNKKRLVLQRQGNDFCVQDPKGVLPNQWTRQDWNRAMALPAISETNNRSNNKNKKRRIIQDDDDDKEDEENNNNSNNKVSHQASGLRVKVSSSSATSDETATSLRSIKTQLGVNAQDLESAREALELETNRDSTDETVLLTESVQRLRAKASKLGRILERLERKNNDYYEVSVGVGHVVVAVDFDRSLRRLATDVGCP